MPPRPPQPFPWPLAIVPCLVLGLFLGLASLAYPALDDWAFASGGRDQGLLAATGAYLAGWGGRWASALLLYGMGALGDVVAWYPWLMLATLGWLALGAGCLLTAAGVARRHLVPGALVLGAVLLSTLPVITIGRIGPHVPTFEAVFWASGAWTYTIAFTPLALAVLLATASVPAGVALPGLALIGVVCAGLSEQAGLAAGAVGLALGLTGRPRAWWLVGGAAAGLAINQLSPGNRVRAGALQDPLRPGQTAQEHTGQAVLDTLRTTASVLGQTLTSPVAWAGAILAGQIGAATAVQGAQLRRPLAVLALLLPLVVAGMLAPVFWAVGLLEGRQVGLVALVATTWILALALLAGRQWPDLLATPSRRGVVVGLMAVLGVLNALAWPVELPPQAVPLRLFAGAFAMAGGVAWALGRGAGLPALLSGALLAMPWAWTMALDLAGKAPVLRARQEARDAEAAALRDAGVRRVLLPWLGQKERMPMSLCVYEIQPGWVEQGYGRWMGLEMVRISPEVERPVPLPAVPSTGTAPRP